MSRPLRSPGTRLAPAGLVLAALVLGGCAGEDTDAGGPLEVAVAANFLSAARALADAFEAETGSEVRLAVGSTGGLYAQIVNGAPYHLFLAADAERPARLEAEGYAVAGTRFTYAVGRLVVFAPRLDGSWDVPEVLGRPGVRAAWADPRAAPYGRAAREALDAWGLGELEGAVGESVAQVEQFVRSGAADVALLSGAQVREAPAGTVRTVPEGLHAPLLQDAVLLRGGEAREDARAFLAMLGSPRGRALIRDAGYELADGGPRGR